MLLLLLLFCTCLDLQVAHSLLRNYTDPDAVIINESKLGYTVYRKDRDTDSGGGIMLLIKNCYVSQELEHTGTSETLWVEVQQKSSRKLYISSF